MSTSVTPERALASSAAAHGLGGDAASVPSLATALVGLHNTTQSTPYLSIRARLAGFRRADLDRPMWDEWSLVRYRAMRLTMFIFTTELLEIVAASTRHTKTGLAERWLRDSGLSQAEFDAVADDVEATLAEGPLTVRALRDVMGVGPSVDLSGVVGRMCDIGRLVGGAPPRSWRSSVRQYHRWVDVLPAVNPHRWNEDQAIRELIRRYVVSYGPVTINDVSWWTGFTKGKCREALSALDTEQVSVDGWPGPMWRIGEHSTELPDTVLALPVLDPYVQGYRDRVRFLNPERNEWVHDWGGNATATLVRRGRVIGVWQVVEKPHREVRYHLFDTQSATVRRAAEEDLGAAGAFYFDRPVDVVEVKEMKSLHADGGRSFNHPLDGHVHRASRNR